MPKETGQENLHNTPGEQTLGTSPAKSTKKRKSIHISEGTAPPYVDVEVDRPSGQLVSWDKRSGAPSIQQVPKLFTFGLKCTFDFYLTFDNL